MAEKLAQTNNNAAIAIILVNWNGWNDTIECLESIFKNDCRDFFVIVCDNDSSDDSVEKIKAWAAGSLPSVPASEVMAPYSTPHIPKPIPLKFINHDGTTSGDSKAKFILIQTGDNLGYAGGNNVGMRYALEKSSCEYFWLLNNDTVIKHDAIRHLIDHMQASNNVGMCGTRIHFYHQPDIIQALGGAKYNKWTGTSKCIGSFENSNYSMPISEIKQKIDFVAGASLVASRDFLDKIGFMNEEYFLFYEEIDWATRSRHEFSLDYCPDSTVFHKEGGASGANSEAGKRSEFAEYYLTKSKLLYTKNHFPIGLPFIYTYTLLQIFIRVFRGNFKKSRILLSLLLGLSTRKSP